MGVFIRLKERTRRKVVSIIKKSITRESLSVGNLAKKLDISLPSEFLVLKNQKVSKVAFSVPDAQKGSAVLFLTTDVDIMINNINNVKKKQPLIIFLDKTTYDSIDKSLISYSDAKIVPVTDFQDHLRNFVSPYRDKYHGKVISVTGSFGKTTTKLFIEQILRDQYHYRFFFNKANNNSTFSVAYNIFSHMNNFYKCFVQEIGASRVDSVKMSASFLRPDFAIITNVKDHHLGNYGSFENLFNDKIQLADKLADGGTAIINFDDENLRKHKYNHNVISYGIDADFPLDYRAKNITSFTEDGRDYIEFDIEHKNKQTHIVSKISGEYNAYNITAAFALANCIGIPENQVIDSISKTSMYGNRQNLTRYGKNTLLVDCYNVANETIISSFNILSDIKPEGSGRKIAVVGAENGLGKNRIAKTEELGKKLAKFDIDQIVCFGVPSKEESALQRFGDARTLCNTLRNEGKENTKLILSNNKLYEFLRDEIKDDDVVLFKCITYLNAPIPIDKAFGTWFSPNTNKVKKNIVIENEDGFEGHKISLMNESLITGCDRRHLKAETLIIPSEFLGQDVFGISLNAFFGGNMKTLDLGTTVKVISAAAFKSCKKLESISFPDSLKHIMRDSFRDCTSLKEITLGKGIRQIDKNAFAGCSSLKRCYIPKNAPVRIEKNAFPDNVEIIEL